VYQDWYPGKWNIDELIETAEVIDGIAFVHLRTVIEWEKIMGREKNERDIMLIKEYLDKEKSL
jgi:hypothetical protein